ncbi:MAG TPA: M13 family metallopeptidase N-terminal domain-containing protein [Candidatus Acidoferrales bacterium]|nr:M13 family metallopeptidase N-terminal domain-containing protein [Candidatus Acidoferrales bacterium]
MKAFAFVILTATLILLPWGLSTQRVRAQRVNPISATVAGACNLAQGTPTQGSDHGFDLSNLDRGVKPCDDFVEFAMGGWLKNNPVPTDRPIWGASNKVQDQNEEILHQILEEAAKSREAAAGSVQLLIGSFYASCMDADEIEKAGLEPLQPELKRIAALESTGDLQTEFAHLQIRGISVPFFFGSIQDFKDSSQQIAFASQSGLGMPNRDYYTKSDEKSKDLRDRYVQHVARMFKLMGDDAATAEGESKTVMAFETKLAKASMTPIQERVLKHIDNKMSPGELKTLTPNFSWEAYFRELGFPGIDSVIVAQKDFFKHVNEQ